MTTNDWVHGFFHGLAIEFWVAVAPQADADLPLLERVFGAPVGQAILDVACGAGRHSIPLARRGYVVTGVDLSTTCTAEARRRAEGERQDVEWQRGDLHEFPWRDRFEGALCFGQQLWVLRSRGDGRVPSVAVGCDEAWGGVRTRERGDGGVAASKPADAAVGWKWATFSISPTPPTTPRPAGLMSSTGLSAAE